MNSSVPRQFHLLKGKPVIYYTINTFLAAYIDVEIILVLPEEYISTGEEIINTFFNSTRIRITAGGKTRFNSVKNGLQLTEEDSIIFVHDAVRCLASVDLIHRCFEEATIYGSAIPVIDCRDSVRFSTGTGSEALDRTGIKLVQTPQTFRGSLLVPAFCMDYSDKFTDEATVVEANGTKVHLVKGEENNIKITHPVDLLVAEYLLSQH